METPAAQQLHRLLLMSGSQLLFPWVFWAGSRGKARGGGWFRGQSEVGTGCMSVLVDVPVGGHDEKLRRRCMSDDCPSPLIPTDLRPLPDVAMTGTCTRECSEFGHSDTCWMPGQSSPSRRTKSSALKLSTFVPYQDRGGQEPAGAGSPSPPEDRNTKTAPVRLLPSYSAFSHSSHDSCKDSATLEEIPLTQTSDFPPAATPASAQTAKREIYL
ncbi:hypothetical protein P7K49_003645 [Saguinus oedipus]|uniref:Protocadherin-9 n=1 Tax=Saguinus oedipus TaxID=9490 RepID=A0ABQ9W560_SAGOE|nr:hypothetical protein P7K49_003645 [Saguinus oedipus]